MRQIRPNAGKCLEGKEELGHLRSIQGGHVLCAVEASSRSCSVFRRSWQAAVPATATYLPTSRFAMHFVGDPVEVAHLPVAYVGPSHVYNAWAIARGNDGTIYTGVTSNSGKGQGSLWASP